LGILFDWEYSDFLFESILADGRGRGDQIPDRYLSKPENKNGKSELFPFSEPVVILVILTLLIVVAKCLFFAALFLASRLVQDLCQKLNIINSFKNNKLGVEQMLICLDCNQWLHTQWEVQ
jgi:hypothetical protein|tara:strand:+ start:658 stop:1020 length:363 start_codon:yes stop_codon:yes gene_type:complete